MKRFLFLSLLVCGPLFAAPPLYVRLGAGIEQSAGTTVADVDCSATQPPALFGCVDGSDGRKLAARGDFGATPSVSIAFGAEFGRVRAEVELADRPRLDLDANANFLNVAGAQPVHADGRSRALMLNVSADVGFSGSRVRPFMTAGAGVARNVVGPVTFTFPSIGLNARTTTAGGSHDAFAWNAGAGLSFRVTDRASIDLAVRHADLGRVQTDAGPATIVRPSRSLTIDIAPIDARLKTTGVDFGLRVRL